MKEPLKERVWDTGFLRHIERNALLLFMVPADAEDYAKEYEILLNELVKYNPELADKQRILAITKSDMIDEDLQSEIADQLPSNIPHLFISSVAGKNIMQLKDLIWEKLNAPCVMYEQLHSLDTNALLALNRLFPASYRYVSGLQCHQNHVTWLPLICCAPSSALHL